LHCDLKLEIGKRNRHAAEDLNFCGALIAPSNDKPLVDADPASSKPAQIATMAPSQAV
jgi:hypothetical protein